jgi:LysM repeat protein
MYRDDDNDQELRGSFEDDGRADYKSPVGSGSGSGSASGSGASRLPRPPARPQARLRSATTRGAASEPWTPATTPRRGPSHPDWERPLTQYDYPQLRGQDEHRAIWPLAAAAMGVTLVVVLLVIIPSILNGRNIAVATATPTPISSASVDPNSSASLNPPASVEVTDPGTSIVFAKTYTVKTGDRFNAIAKKYGLQQWELLQANPQVTNPNALRVGMVLNIPAPGQMVKPGATPRPSGSASPTVSPSPSPSPSAT